MATSVKYRIRDGVAIATLSAPNGNPVDAAMRASLWEVFGRIGAQPDVHAAILIAEGKVFSGGDNVARLGSPEAAPTLAALCARIEALPVPVVAGLHGMALGAGLSLALACSHRIAAKGAQLGLPEATLGLIPSGGTTQRLPRLVGAATALDMLLSARPVSADAALDIGLIDAVTPSHVHEAAFEMARALADEDAPPRPVGARGDRLSDGRAYLAAVADRRGIVQRGSLHAPHRIVDCIEAAILLPFGAGLDFEEDALARCRAHPQSEALRHAFIAERVIDPRLMAETGGRRGVTDPDGRAVVSRLQHVMGAVAEHLVTAGKPADLVDRALVDFGFLRTPFGGREGGAGASGEAIADRFVAAMMAEGARIMADRMVDRASDIDALAINGAGFPRLTGGPMKAAQIRGLLGLQASMRRWREESPLWEPPPLLSEALKTSAGFDALVRVKAS